MNTKATTPPKSAGLTVQRPSASNGLAKSLREMKEESVRFNVDLDKSQHKRLKLFAVTKDVDMTELVRKWIKEGLDNEGAPEAD